MTGNSGQDPSSKPVPKFGFQYALPGGYNYVPGNPGMMSQPSPSMMGYPGMAPSPQGTIQEPSFVPIFSHFFSQRNQAGFGGQSQEKQFQLFKNHPLATNCLYIDGIPNDAKEREVSHIFRPYPGFIESRLITKEAKSGRKFYYCFADFENSVQASIALQSLEGYRFHKKDKTGLKISYAKPTHLLKKKRKRSKSSSSD